MTPDEYKAWQAETKRSGDNWIMDTVPKPYAEWQSWYPAQPVILPDGERHVFGWADYDESLTFDQVWGYDMLPADPIEQTRYLLWLAAGRDAEQAGWLEEDYKALPVEALRADRGRIAELVLRLMDYESNRDTEEIAGN